MMTMPEISKHDLLAVRQFLTSSRIEGLYAHVLDDRSAGGGSLRARMVGRRDRRDGAASAFAVASGPAPA